MASEEQVEIDVDIEGDDTIPYDADDYYEDDEQTFTVDDPELEKTQKESGDTAPISVKSLDGAYDEELTKTSSQGVKRKSDDRQVDSGATTALVIDDLHWWISEDDIRGWVNEAAAEDDLIEVSFNEHKVNGKSKGQAYLAFNSPHASTAAKHRIEDLTEGPGSSRKFAVSFASSTHNPYKTLPKDAPARAKEDRNSAYNTRGNYSRGDNPGFRGRGRGFDRGGYNNRNFSGPAGGYNNNNGAFQNNMGMMNNNFGFNRGGMGNMRGNMGGMRGRGGMNSMMPMGFNPMMAGMGMSGRSHERCCTRIADDVKVFRVINLVLECLARVLALIGVSLGRRDNDRSRRSSSRRSILQRLSWCATAWTVSMN